MKKNQFFITPMMILLPFFSYAAQKCNLRDMRYCEIILNKTLMSYSVYTTWGLNDCPENKWAKVTVEAVKKETGTRFAHLNGPRYWVIDGFRNSSLINPAIKTIAYIQMREAGVLHLSLMDLLKSKPYRQHIVDRQTTWIYQAGKPVYELIDPQGNVFVMQSYSVAKQPQSKNSLAQLGSKLARPVGWTFKTGVLKKSEDLKAINNRAVVIQDNFLNTYQMATHDFLKN